MKQVKFLDKYVNEVKGGLLLDNGDIICGCCGTILKANQVEIQIIYKYWVDLSDEIIWDSRRVY